VCVCMCVYASMYVCVYVCMWVCVHASNLCSGTILEDMEVPTNVSNRVFGRNEQLI